MSKKKSSQKPKKKIKVSTAKRPLVNSEIAPSNVLSKKPVWRLGRLDFYGDWGFSNIDNLSDFKIIQEKLKIFESMTWGEIGKNNKNHFIGVGKISREAQGRLEQIRLSEYDTLYSLRFSGLERLWGIRKNEILYILWWDREHTVYPVEKRHT